MLAKTDGRRRKRAGCGGGGGADLEDKEQRQDGGEAAETGGLTAPHAP